MLRRFYRVQYSNEDLLNFIFIIAGILFNFNYLLEPLGISVKGFSLIFLLLIIIAMLNGVSFNRIKPVVILLLFLFTGYYVFTFLYSNFSSYSSYKLGMFLIKNTLVLFLPFLLKDKIPFFFKGYFFSLLLSVLIFLPFSLAQFSEIGIHKRLIIGNLNSIWIARIAIECLLLALIYYFRFKTLRIIILAIITIFVTYLSGSKGPLLFGLLTFLLYLLKDLSGHKKLLLVLLILAAIPFVISYINKLEEDSYFVQRFLKSVPEEASQKHHEESRIVVWPRTLKNMGEMNFKLITGVGLGDFNTFDGYPPDKRHYPHNILLEVAVEQGIPFLLLFLFLFAYAFYHGNSIRYLLLFYFLNANVTGDIIFNERYFFYLGVCLMNISLTKYD